MENKNPLCFPFSSLPRQSFISVVAEGVGALDPQVLPFPLARSATCNQVPCKSLSFMSALCKALKISGTSFPGRAS